MLIALDAETGAVIWNKEMPLFTGVDSSLVINGEQLHVFESNHYCFNVHNGEEIYVKYGDNGRTYLDGVYNVTVYNNFLYWFSYEFGIGYERYNKIISLDANNGSLAWKSTINVKDSPESEYFVRIASSPQVYGNKLYLLSDGGLLVYNANNGKFIGVNRSFKGPYNGETYNFIYKDRYIFIHYPDSGKSLYLNAIRCK
jgi:outer membrane protein assembly factor BamB